MKCSRWPVVLFFLAFVPFARADTFDITQITFMVGPFNASLPGQISFTLMGAGTDISGIGNFVCGEAWCGFPATGVAPGALTTTIGQIGLDSAFQSTVGGITLLEHSWTLIDLSLNVLQEINLPANPESSTFSTCVPATVPNLTFGEGQKPDLTVFNFDLNTPKNGTFCTTWNFSNGQYTFLQGTFVARTAPEPGTMALILPGLIFLIGLLRCPK